MTGRAGSSLARKVALVTGSSRGIGAAIARRLAAEGARVAVHGRDAERLAAVRAEIAKAGGEAIAVAVDLTRLADVERMRAEIERALGPVEILVANAGGAHARIFSDVRRDLRASGERAAAAPWGRLFTPRA